MLLELSRGNVDFGEGGTGHPVALHFGAYYGWPKTSRLFEVIAEQKRRVTEEWAAEA